MTISNNRKSYEDVFETWEAALNDPKGIRLPFDAKGDANHYRMRLNTARMIDRRENKAIYEEGDVLYNASAYDGLQARIVGPVEDSNSKTGETWFVYIEPRDKNVPEIERLSEIEDEEAAE